MDPPPRSHAGHTLRAPFTYNQDSNFLIFLKRILSSLSLPVLANAHVTDFGGRSENAKFPSGGILSFFLVSCGKQKERERSGAYHLPTFAQHIIAREDTFAEAIFIMDIVQKQLKVLRTKLDKYPVFHEAEVSNCAILPLCFSVSLLRSHPWCQKVIFPLSGQRNRFLL